MVIFLDSLVSNSMDYFAFNLTSEFAMKRSSLMDNFSTMNSLIVCDEITGFPPPNPLGLHSSVATPILGSVTVQNNLCEHFAFPPPPPSKRRRIGPRPCPVCYLPVEQAIASMPSSPSASPVHHLSYYHEAHPVKTEPHGGSDFGGYPSLNQRNDSFSRILQSYMVEISVRCCCNRNTESNAEEKTKVMYLSIC